MFALTIGLVALTVTAPERTTVSAGTAEVASAVGVLLHWRSWRISDVYYGGGEWQAAAGGQPTEPPSLDETRPA